MESQHRASMLKVLGKEKYEFFFDKWLEYFFTEKDAEFFASKGLNCLRLPFNYRHFEDDMNPRVLKTEGFKHLDRVVDIVRDPVCSVSKPSDTPSVREVQDLHNSGPPHSAWRSEPRLALGQRY